MARLHVRPSPVVSAIAAVMAVGFTIFGIVMSLDNGHPFLILWTLLAAGAAIYHGYNALSGGRGFASEVIDVDDTPRAMAPHVSQADKLRELKRLADDGVISAVEYERKKDEILRSAW
jgi:hypothetical protein